MLGKVKRYNWDKVLKQTENKAVKKKAKALTIQREEQILGLTAEDAAAAEERRRILFTRVLPIAAIGLGLLWYMKRRK